MDDDIRYNAFILRDKPKEIKRVKSHGINIIISGYRCLCGHTQFISDNITKFPFLNGDVFVEDISCMKCQRIFKIEHD
jgi:hypothetical protein